MSYREEPVYVDNLLALRGLCSLGVALVHLIGESDLAFRNYLLTEWQFGEFSQIIVSSLIISTGKNFVLFFFVHSGYLMGKVFFMERYEIDGSGLTRFYKGRFWRIAPLLYVNLLVCWLLLPSANPTTLEALGDFLFINNFTGRDINTVTWSLSWEMQYYLIAPFVFLLFANISKKTFYWILVASLFFLILSALDIRKYPPIEYFFYFMIGYAINIALRHFKQRQFRGCATLAVVGGFFGGNFIYYLLFNNGFEEVANPFIGIMAAVTVYILELPRKDETNVTAQSQYSIPWLLFLRFWTWTGILSYGIYLWHVPVQYLIDDFVRDWTLSILQSSVTTVTWQSVLIFHSIQLPLALGATILISLATFFLVETRFRPNLYSWDSSRFLFKHFLKAPESRGQIKNKSLASKS